MSLLSDLYGKVVSLITRLNQIEENAKTNDELPTQTELVLSSKIRVSNSGESEIILVEDIILKAIEATQPYLNRFLETTGISSVGLGITISPNWVWMINGIRYTNLSETTFLNYYSATGFERIDIIVAGEDNDFQLIHGEEAEIGVDTPVAPVLPVNALLATTILVGDDTMDSPTLPESGYDFLIKSHQKEYIINTNWYDGDTVIFNPTSGTTYRIQALGTTGFLSNTWLVSGTPFEGQEITISNETETDLLIKHLVSSGSTFIPFYFPNESDYNCTVNECLKFRFINGYWQYVGVISGSGGSTPDATTTVKGKAQLATPAEGITGTNNTKIVTPLVLKAVTDALLDTGGAFLNALNDYQQFSQDFTDAEIATLKDGVATPGNTLQKLYNLILGASAEEAVANIAARDAYNVPHLPFSIFVTDDGDGRWAKYQATTTGVGATFVKISDPDLLNAVMSTSAIKASYESNSDTNAFTNDLLAKLDGIAANATNFTVANVLATLLTGISFATGSAIVSTDSVLIAFGKIQKQITDGFTGANIRTLLGITTLSGSNTGDETTASIQSKRPLKTLNGNSLEGTGDVTISGGSSFWGGITGTLSAQTDLQTALNGKQANLTDVIFGTFANSLTAKNTLIDADEVISDDSADSSRAKKTSWLNVWTNYIKVKTDASYQPILVSGTSIKTLNSISLLGSGNIAIGGAQFVTPEQYGAVGNGTTNDAAAFQAAINSGFPIMLGEKNYRISTSLTTGSNLYMVGSGKASIMSTTSNITILRVSGSFNTIKDIAFVGNSTGGNQNGIFANGSTSPSTISNLISGCWFNNFGLAGLAGSLTIGSSGSRHEGIFKVSDCTFEACVYGIYLFSSAEYSSFSNCHISNCTNGVVFASGNNNFIGGQVTNCTTGIFINTGTNDSHCAVVGTKINHNTTNIQCAQTLIQTFDSCQVYAGSIILTGTGKTVFSSCQLSFASSSLTITNSPVTFDNCDFVVLPTYTLTGVAPIMNNCYAGASRMLTPTTSFATTSIKERPVLANSFTATGTATTTFTVTIGVTQGDTTYKVAITPTNALSAASFHVTNKTTTSFDLVYGSGLTGLVAFDWILKP